MKEWRAWEYLVRRTIIGLERVTKDSEMKWVVTKGNESLSIIPLSSIGDKRRPMWVADRGSEFRMIRMGLDRVWNVNVLTVGSWIKRLGFWVKPSNNFDCFPHNALPQMSSSRNTPGATVFGPGIRGNPPRAVYERLSRRITRSIATNLPHMPADLTTPYPTANEVRLRT